MSNKLDFFTAFMKNAFGEKLFSLLSSIEGKKDLILDKVLIRSLDYIATFSQLKACNVEKVFKLEPGSAPGATNKNVYLIKPSVKNAKIVADQINASKSIESPKQFWVINVPRKLFASDTVFEREGVYGFATQMEFSLGFLSLDKDLLSLELEDFFAAFYLNGDLTYVHTAAMALVQLRAVCGPFTKIFGQGSCAKMVLDLMNMISNELVFEVEPIYSISHLLIFDRDVDNVPLFLSQLTYEGMLDEFFGIESGRVSFPKSVTKNDKPVKVVLSSSDEVFEEIRNNYFTSVFSLLRDKAKELNAKSEATKSMSIVDMKNFVAKEMKKIKQQQASLILHIGACEVILNSKSEENFQDRLRIESDILDGKNYRVCINYIETLINRMDPFVSALRLMCLLSVSQDGLLPSDYRSLWTQFRQAYGCVYTPTLYNLKKLGLFVEQAPILPPIPVKRGLTEVASSKASKIAEKVATAVSFPKNSSFKTTARKFSLMPQENEEIDLKNPTHPSYVFGGTYTPLIVKLVEQIIVHGDFVTAEEGMKLLPGTTITNIKSDKGSGHITPSKDINTKTILVYMLGGITFAEIAALRLLGKVHNCQILIATTSIISAGSLMKILSPALQCET